MADQPQLSADYFEVLLLLALLVGLVQQWRLRGHNLRLSRSLAKAEALRLADAAELRHARDAAVRALSRKLNGAKRALAGAEALRRSLELAAELCIESLLQLLTGGTPDIQCVCAEAITTLAGGSQQKR